MLIDFTLISKTCPALYRRNTYQCTVIKLMLFLVSFAWSVGGVDLHGSKESQRPNVLFIAVDDLRMDLGCYGNSHVITPNLDRLASEGVRFTRAYCQQAVCNPSRASALTGLRPDTLKVWDLHTHFREYLPEVETLPAFFKRHGYRTRSIGKVFHNDTRRVEGRPPMADPVSWSDPPLLATGAHWHDWVVRGDPFGPERKQESWQSLDVPDEAYFDGQVAALAMSALRDLAENDEPFFLAVGLWKPHLPFNAPKRYWDLYERDDFLTLDLPSAPSVVTPYSSHNWHELRTYTDIPGEGDLSADLAALLWHGYYACISYLDVQTGKILDVLRETGLDENTIVVFWSDHGFHLGERGLWGKTSAYELDAQVPLIFSGPGLERRGDRANGIVELIDMYPTLAEWVGLPVPQSLEGNSLLPLIRNPDLPGKEVAITQSPYPFYGQEWTQMGYSFRTDKFRYIEWRNRSDGEVIAQELYHHPSDPEELHNLVDHPDHREALRQLKALARRTAPTWVEE